MKTIIIISLFITFNVSAGPSTYNFTEMNCLGSLDSGYAARAWSSIAIRITNESKTITDVLGQSKTRELKWMYTFDETELGAKKSLAKKGGSIFLTPALTMISIGSKTIVSYVNKYRNFDLEKLKLHLQSSFDKKDHLEGFYFDRENTYKVKCIANKAI